MKINDNQIDQIIRDIGFYNSISEVKKSYFSVWLYDFSEQKFSHSLLFNKGNEENFEPTLKITFSPLHVVSYCQVSPLLFKIVKLHPEDQILAFLATNIQQAYGHSELTRVIRAKNLEDGIKKFFSTIKSDGYLIQFDFAEEKIRGADITQEIKLLATAFEKMDSISPEKALK